MYKYIERGMTSYGQILPNKVKFAKKKVQVEHQHEIFTFTILIGFHLIFMKKRTDRR